MYSLKEEKCTELRFRGFSPQILALRQEQHVERELGSKAAWFMVGGKKSRETVLERKRLGQTQIPGSPFNPSPRHVLYPSPRASQVNTVKPHYHRMELGTGRISVLAPSKVHFLSLYFFSHDVPFFPRRREFPLFSGYT